MSKAICDQLLVEDPGSAPAQSDLSTNGDGYETREEMAARKRGRFVSTIFRRDEYMKAQAAKKK